MLSFRLCREKRGRFVERDSREEDKILIPVSRGGSEFLGMGKEKIAMSGRVAEYEIFSVLGMDTMSGIF